MRLFFVSLLMILGFEGRAAVAPGNYLMPLNCLELLPDSSPFTGFFEAVARGMAGKDRQLSKRLFKILSLRDRIANQVDQNREPNPLDTLIQKTICFYREQKEPLKPITFDDADFIKFLKNGLKDLEGKVDDTVFHVEFERFQRQEYERRANKNRGTIEVLQREAERDAENSFDRISSAARRKVRVPE